MTRLVLTVLAFFLSHGIAVESLNCGKKVFFPDELERCIRLYETVGTRANAACEKIKSNKINPMFPLIYGGEVAILGQFPHMVALGYRTTQHGKDYDFKCGGALITATHILTAAHCITDSSEPVVARMGAINLSETNDPESSMQDRRILSMKKHPQYRRGVNDIAIIRIAPANISSVDVYPICIDTRSTPPPSDSQISVCGFGEVNSSGHTSNELLFTNLTVVTSNECVNKYKSMLIRATFTDGQFCAWDPAFVKDACKGDSGGPVHQKINQIDFLIGIVSYGLGCASNMPGVYTRVSNYIDWIENEVWNN